MTGELRDRPKRNSSVDRSSNRRGGRTGGDSEFINRELTAEEVRQYRLWREDFAEVLRVWDALLEEGYRVNTKWDDYSSAFAVFIIPSPEHEHSGLILTGRGGNAYRAVAEACFKHEFIFRGSWSVSTQHPTRDTDPDF